MRFYAFVGKPLLKQLYDFREIYPPQRYLRPPNGIQLHLIYKVKLATLAFEIFHDCTPPSMGHILTADRLAELVEHRTAVREVAGSNLGRTNTRGL